MNPLYFYIYLVTVGISILLFTFLRCQYDFRTFDYLLYPNENNNILANYTFLAYHCITYAALGYLFGFEVLYSMILKIVFFETYLFFIEYCDIFETSPSSHLIITLIFSLFSYLFGCMLSSVSSKLM
jgi:hypothetical protein